MIAISLTDFIDFLISSGTPKLNKVRSIKARPEYHPVMDFWKEARERIIKYHQEGEGNRKYLDVLLQEFVDTKKYAAYAEVVAGYKRFLGTKQIKFLPCPRAEWHHKELTVRVNPELILTLKDRPTVIKLYFKAEPISKLKTDVILLLMSFALEGRIRSGHDYGVLDVRRSKLTSSAEPLVTLAPLLFGEAENFIVIWNNLS